MENLSERLLHAWLRVSTTIVNSRVVSELSYNETLVCHMLCRGAMENPDRRLTATDLCAGTKMLKSQMNRTLNSLEAKGMISRERSSDDRRQVLVSLNMDRLGPYELQHDRILQILGHIIDEMGEERTEEIIGIFSHIADIADDALQSPQNGEQGEKKGNE